MASRAVCLACATNFGADFLFGLIASVDNRVDTAHDDHVAGEFFLQFDDVVAHQCALPDIDANFSHIGSDGLAEAIGMVNDDYALFFHVAIDAAIVFFEKLTPNMRREEQVVVGTPIIMRQNRIGMQVVDKELGVGEAVFGDGVDEFFCVFRFQEQVGECVLKAHEEMGLLENTRTHKAH